MKCLAARLVAGVLAGAASLVFSTAAQASLVNDVSVTLSAPGGLVGGPPTPILATQTATLADGIKFNDGGAIGSVWMLDGEQIVFSGNSILLQVDAGQQNAGGDFVTGYLGSGGQHALYRLDNLNIAGEEIVGYTAYDFDGYATSGNSGLISPIVPADYVHLLSPNSLSFDLDTLVFKDRGDPNKYNYADFRIDLVTRPVNQVPEPPMLALALTSLALLALRRRKAGSAAP